MARYQFHLLNVFAESTFGGNPLCVFEAASGMTEATMQALARQFNLSETTFVLPSSEADARVRIFTPGYEMPFAGHPTLGTAYVVRQLVQRAGPLLLEMNAGMVPVEENAGVWILTAPGTPVTRSTGLRAELIARMLGLTMDDLSSPPVWVDTGNEQLLVPLKSSAAVLRAAPSSALIGQWPLSGRGRRNAYVFALDTEAEVTSRYFSIAPEGGISEDPGTGSACANLGAWLLSRGQFLPADFRVSQGDATGRPCRLTLRLEADRRIKVGGRVIEIGRGFVDI